MSSAAEASEAVKALHGKDMGGRDMVVNIAKPMESRPPRSGGYGNSRY